ncbi:uncharacterized protein LOC124886706 [Capsicum annuum]|uniref:uncharacterized protein LOC124886706 n=1 Tax=Capsicum annuum TaxID=4072 RepID=UPI001FB07AB1|nr:uncharacterized protein LOC124886706 [Capsicum annuum]
MGLTDTIKNDNKASNQNKAKAMIFLRHHLDEEVNAVNFLPTRCERSSDLSRSDGRGRGRDRYFNHGDYLAINNNPQHQQYKKKGEAPEAAPRTNSESRCYRCGGKRHLSRTYRTPKHLVKLYQDSLKRIENDVETNFHLEDSVEPMDLEVSDFFAIFEEHVNLPVGDNHEIV